MDQHTWLEQWIATHLQQLTAEAHVSGLFPSDTGFRISVTQEKVLVISDQTWEQMLRARLPEKFIPVLRELRSTNNQQITSERIRTLGGYKNFSPGECGGLNSALTRSAKVDLRFGFVPGSGSSSWDRSYRLYRRE